MRVDVKKGDQRALGTLEPKKWLKRPDAWVRLLVEKVPKTAPGAAGFREILAIANLQNYFQSPSDNMSPGST